MENGGSANGHNGLKSIIDCFGKDFVRVRVGIGRPLTRNSAAVAKYVLGNFTRQEDEFLQCGFLDEVCADIEHFAKEN